ncbi:MAG TPA: ATP-binding protein, partial [Sphingomonadaceae bacterium]|nr:ATP-binding protein [Sphingomonadaceae bacterium]
IAAAGQHLLALIDDLSDLEVVEAEEFTTAPDRIDLADVTRRAVGILAVRAQEQGIAIDPPALTERLPAIGEFRRVLQVLLNLIGNAIRYAPEGSRVHIDLVAGAGKASVTIADEGQGLSEEQQAKVFDKFERLGRSGDGGSGLGLYISRKLARAMGGELSVRSTPGKGARFTLTLPCEGE